MTQPAPPLDVSVIIVTRNTCRLTLAAVGSVFESRKAPTLEIIVVDNGSTDDSRGTLTAEFPQVVYIYSDRNLGFAAANNLGASKARGEFLLLLNSDARLQPETLNTTLAWMRAHPECGVTGVQLLNPDGSRQNSIANFPTLATELLNKSLLRRLFPRRYPGKEQRFAEPLEVESVIGAFMLIRADVWRQLNGLDAGFFFFLEETDFCARVRQAGCKVFHLPQAQVWHEQGRSATQTPAAARIEYWRSRYHYFRKHAGPFTRAALRTGLVLRLFIDWLGSLMVVLLTFGQSEKPRHKWRVTSVLWLWHFRGCPASMGLPR